MPTRPTLSCLYALAAAVCLLMIAGCGSPAPSALPAAVASPLTGASRCVATASDVVCSKHDLWLPALLTDRQVSYEVPLGTPPAGGWPVVLYFQGSFFSGARAFAASRGDAFNAYDLTRTVKSLLDAGYAVLAPSALLDGTTFWQTNVPPWSALWETSSDHAFVLAIFQAILAGQLGPLDGTRLYAMGISSGGFMTSRMAVSYRGMFRALAVHSASYATCSSLCIVPPLPADHPPTLFLHGGLDLVVPVPTMEAYRDALLRAGRAVRTVIDPAAGHQWLAAGPAEIPAWFAAHP